jgi:hypothetical protein
MTCHPLITAAVRHVWPLALRRIRRAIRRHAVHAAAAGLTIVCAGAPAIVLTLPPATVEPQGAPVDVPEPAGLWVMGVGLVGLGLVRVR